VTEAPAPIDDEEFAALMHAVGPFEPAPRLAVAVSGGPDSLALALLAAEWVRARAGSLSALIVDHGLRPEAGGEARLTCAWLRARGIEGEILRWEGEKPVSGIQAHAREARYRLLLQWCRRRGVVHLLLGHHAFDQTETVLMRLFGGSGVEGLAGILPIRYTPFTRVVRPLLPIDPARLRASLIARGQAWLEDPTNADQAYTRARFRLALSAFPAAMGMRDKLARLQATAVQAAERLDAAVDDGLARCCEIDRLGFAWVDEEAFAAVPEEIAWRLLARVLCGVGGTDWPPAAPSVRALRGRILTRAGRPSGSLGRCRLMRRDRRLLICREGRHLPAPVAVEGGETVLWDGRFLVRIPPRHVLGAGRYRLMPAPQEVWRHRPQGPAAAQALNRVPSEARLGLPVMVGESGEAILPQAMPPSGREPKDASPPPLAITFSPRRVLKGTGRFLALAQSRIMLWEEAPPTVLALEGDTARPGAEQEEQREY
jgi:tRNA(Ile)-lysidine synthase